MRSVPQVIGSLCWSAFFGFLTYLLAWVFLAQRFGLALGREGDWARVAGAAIGVGFAIHTFSKARAHLGPGIGDFILFPLRYASGLALSLLFPAGIAWVLWHNLHGHHLALAIIAVVYLLFFALPVASASFAIPFERELTLASIIRSMQTARRIGFPFPGFVRNYFDEKIQDAKEGSEHLRGARLTTRRHAEQRARALLEPGGPPPLPWCGIPLPRRLASTGLLATGMTGSGKTAHLNYLLRSVLPSLGQHGESRALIYDYKVEAMVYLLARFPVPAERIKLFHPFDQRSVVWDVAADVLTESDAMELTRVLLPAPQNSPDAEFFSKAAALIVGGVIQTFNENAPGNWDLRDLVLAVEDPEQIREVLEASDSNKGRLRTFFSGEAPAMTASVLATIAKDIQYYRVVASQWYYAQRDYGAERYSLTEWMQSNDVIVLGHSPSHRAAVEPIMRLIFELTAKRFLNDSQHTDSRPDRSWFVLDELPNLGRLNILGELLRAGRSKGACVFLGFQDLSSLYKAYDPDTAHSLLNNIGNQAYLKLNDPRTAEWASKFFAEREVLRRSHTKGRDGEKTSTQESTHDRAIVPPRKFLEANAAGSSGVSSTQTRLVPGSGELPVSQVIRDVPSPTDEEKKLYAHQRAEERPLPPWTKDDRERLGLLPAEDPRAEDPEPPSSPKAISPPSRAGYRKHREPRSLTESQEI